MAVIPEFADEEGAWTEAQDEPDGKSPEKHILLNKSCELLDWQYEALLPLLQVLTKSQAGLLALVEEMDWEEQSDLIESTHVGC